MEERPEEQQDGAPTRTSEGASTSGSTEHDDGFIRHKVSRLDTLAGLAIKYNVTVSDIKRANGMLSDIAMFAREYLLIPTKQLPIGEEAQVLMARLMSGYGRDKTLNAAERRAPGTCATVQLPGSPDRTPPNGALPPLSVRHGGGGDDGDAGTPYSRRSDRSGSEPGDVELMSRGAQGSEVIGFSGAGAYGADRVRRRRKDGEGADAGGGGGLSDTLTWLAGAATAAVSTPLSGSRTPPARSSTTDAGAGGSGGPHPRQQGSSALMGAAASAAFKQLSTATGSLVDKIKRAASQPALGPSGAHQGPLLSDAADGVLAARGGGGAWPSGGGARPSGGGGEPARGLMPAGSASSVRASSVRKDSKAD